MNITCMNGKCLVFAYPGAFTKKSWHKLCQHPGIDQIIKVSRQEAMQFALNWVEINDTVILGNDVPKTQSALKEIGKKVLIRPLSQFQLAGGSAACVVLGRNGAGSSPTRPVKLPGQKWRFFGLCAFQNFSSAS